MAPTASTPPRRSLAGWALLAVLVIIGSYVFTVLLAIACVYLPLLMLRGPLFLSAIFLVVGGVSMAITMLRSLAPRRDKAAPPGPRLEADQEPRLFAELEGIAKALNEPMPREVYLIADVNAFVTERGGALGSRKRRVMGLGLPLLRILTVSQFRAVLAHEFGHYYAGDTRLGPWVYKTRLTMFRTLVSLQSGSGAMRALRINALAMLARNLVLSALQWYWKLFMRATLAVSRRLEFRADELACWVAGAPALIDGLCTIAKGAAGGPAFWQTELAPALQAGYRPPVAEGFGRFMEARGIALAASALLETELHKTKTNPYDTHPPLSVRVAAARATPYQTSPENPASAITLIDHLDALELQLLEARLPQLKKATLRPMPWDKVGVEIYIPGWRKYVTAYKALLADLAVDSLPEAAKNAKQLGARMRDPKGMLLTHEQRAGRASALLWMAFALALIDSGWELHAQPGESYLIRDGLPPINPSAIVAGLQSGKLAPDEWRKQCEAAGIVGLAL
ncbi:MAG TPA: M48 family metallopeptidase [Bryobacteraceae bacterium]|nr:M48 family metallopeptidase [Bryobacteraceae bacterium]